MTRERRRPLNDDDATVPQDWPADLADRLYDQWREEELIGNLNKHANYDGDGGFPPLTHEGGLGHEGAV